MSHVIRTNYTFHTYERLNIVVVYSGHSIHCVDLCGLSRSAWVRALGGRVQSFNWKLIVSIPRMWGAFFSSKNLVHPNSNLCLSYLQKGKNKNYLDGQKRRPFYHTIVLHNINCILKSSTVCKSLRCGDVPIWKWR